MTTVESTILAQCLAAFGVEKNFRIPVEGDERGLPMPKLPKLKTIPNLLTERGVAREMMEEKTPEREASVRLYAKCLGLWCGLWLVRNKYDRKVAQYIGDSFDGTRARAEWDLSGNVSGIRTAVVGLALDTHEATDLWTEGHNELHRIAAQAVVR
jgi:hypothetical protein